MEQDIIVMQEIFRFRQVGIDQNGKAIGQFEATGVRPSFVSRIEAAASSCRRIFPGTHFDARLTGGMDGWYGAFVASMFKTCESAVLQPAKKWRKLGWHQ